MILIIVYFYLLNATQRTISHYYTAGVQLNKNRRVTYAYIKYNTS